MLDTHGPLLPTASPDRLGPMAPKSCWWSPSPWDHLWSLKPRRFCGGLEPPLLTPSVLVLHLSQTFSGDVPSVTPGGSLGSLVPSSPRFSRDHKGSEPGFGGATVTSCPWVLGKHLSTGVSSLILCFKQESTVGSGTLDSNPGSAVYCLRELSQVTPVLKSLAFLTCHMAIRTGPNLWVYPEAEIKCYVKVPGSCRTRPGCFWSSTFMTEKWTNSLCLLRGAPILFGHSHPPTAGWCEQKSQSAGRHLLIQILGRWIRPLSKLQAVFSQLLVCRSQLCRHLLLRIPSTRKLCRMIYGTGVQLKP